MKKIFLKTKEIIIIPIRHNLLLDNLKFNLITKSLLNEKYLFLFEYNKHNYFKDKNKIKKNSVYYLVKKLENLNIKYSFIDTEAKKQNDLFIRKVTWTELFSLYLFSFFNNKNRVLIKNKFPLFYKYILEDREMIMIKKIKEKLISSNKNLVIIIGEIHCQELFNKINLLKNAL